MTEKTLVLTDVVKRYPNGALAVDRVNVDVNAGELVVFVGPSGCGKSTLLRMVAGLETVTDGSIELAGRVVNDLEPAERDIAMVFQNYALYPHMSVRKNLSYGLKNRGLPADEINRRVEEAAEILEIGAFLDRKPSQLSGGQRQRVAMGRAIVRHPAIFLFDEPLSNLDARLRNRMRVEIRKLQRRLNTAMIYVTHDQVEAMTLADRIVVLNGGRVEQIGSPAEVYGDPASTFVASFIGAPPMNLIEVGIEAGRAMRDGVALPLPPSHDGALPAKAIWGLRPERARVGDDGNGIPFTIDVVEELGASRLLHGRIGGAEFTLQQDASAPPPSQATTLLIDPRDVHLFDAETGKAL
ncbi:sn-glycerol 3-phosphate transport system ATP-binding protein [Albidovulum inexpectatum]|uniref:sn-glycerol 3-phosphate transport system ATP-binding protein n=1 Tax=Albidovulum inexpectatum TaxID=196587 RepID=A0A2S5JEZ8_9RHOB|nr:sn-glycerol-3-phosphate ABC transporter ATP-binding protein UgpC [Albidovulum inexpectatum]PPB79970.1 sn-glycerol 3-phosphate transport system ATP-binding protein [Albidovulum inexpectatum]